MKGYIRSSVFSILFRLLYILRFTWGNLEANGSTSCIRTNSLTSSNLSLRKASPKIAFVFAGSARSFVCPKVHWSIRTHLIDALGGESFVFVRISEEDNKNIHTGVGERFIPTYEVGEVEKTLRVLNPKVVQRFSFSSQEEEMIARFPSVVHKLYRENDRRRYSMFFHRSMAYEMAMKYETVHNIRFDWVTLIRLDAAWLEPVLPIQMYQNDRVWLTETGFTPFNDQFMLIPRQFSDQLFDLDTKMQRNVYCLGGPDVEKFKCKLSYWAQKNASAETLELVASYCCSDIQHANILGYSELIHFRHLRSLHIPVSLGYFPVLLTRLNTAGHKRKCAFQCDRLVYNMKNGVLNPSKSDYQYEFYKDSEAVWPDSRINRLSYSDQSKCLMVMTYSKLWKPFSAASAHFNIDDDGNKTTATSTTARLVAGASYRGGKAAAAGPATDQAILLSRTHRAGSHSPHSQQGHDRSELGSPFDFSQRLTTEAARAILHPSVPLDPRDLDAWMIHPVRNPTLLHTASHDGRLKACQKQAGATETGAEACTTLRNRNETDLCLTYAFTRGGALETVQQQADKPHTEKQQTKGLAPSSTARQVPSLKMAPCQHEFHLMHQGDFRYHPSQVFFLKVVMTPPMSIIPLVDKGRQQQRQQKQQQQRERERQDNFQPQEEDGVLRGYQEVWLNSIHPHHFHRGGTGGTGCNPVDGLQAGAGNQRNEHDDSHEQQLRPWSKGIVDFKFSANALGQEFSGPSRRRARRR